MIHLKPNSSLNSLDSSLNNGRLAFTHSDKHAEYDVMADMVVKYCTRHSSPPMGFVSMPKTCEVVPLVFSVFGDLHDESFSWLCKTASDNGCGVSLVAPFLSESCVAIASCASAVHVESSKLCAKAQRRC